MVILSRTRVTLKDAVAQLQPHASIQDTQITVTKYDGRDYISLTDMANAKECESRAADIIKNWIRNRYTIEFLGTWEMMHNPDFKVVEFDHFKSQAGLPSFVMSVSGLRRRMPSSLFPRLVVTAAHTPTATLPSSLPCG